MTDLRAKLDDQTHDEHIKALREQIAKTKEIIEANTVAASRYRAIAFKQLAKEKMHIDVKSGMDK